jgi:DNA-binding response OmpR family regulator
MEKNIHILLIEDDQDDIDLLREALKDNKVSHSIDILSDGSLVAPYLHTCNSYPDVIILDFNLPKVHGREILKMFKNTSNFTDIPLIILTTSSAKEDVEYSISNGASRFMTKPSSVKEIRDMVNAIMSIAVDVNS